MDPDRSAAELPAVDGQVVLEGARAPGRIVGRRPRRVARRGHEQGLVLGDDAAERVWVASQRFDLLVPLVHREAVDPDIGEGIGLGQAGALAELQSQPAEDIRCHGRAVGDDEDGCLRSPRPPDERALGPSERYSRRARHPAAGSSAR